MNVSEVEARLGMTRANIRFYEKEGLLRPARSQNTYRDYSEEDVKALEKVKLLRQLHLDLDTIRALQRGEAVLADALEEQMPRLHAECISLVWAEGVCRDLTARGVAYSELDAQPYLERAAPAGAVLDHDRLETVAHPWRRFFARFLDLGFYGLLWDAVRLLLLRWNPEGNILVTLLNAYIAMVLMLMLEPLLLSTWGYTPGKWLLGLEVQDREGSKLSLPAAGERTLGVFQRGMGYWVPIYNLVRLWRCRLACLRGESMEWETGLYRLRDERSWRTAAVVGAVALQFLLTFMVVSRAAMPIHRGDLTAGEFYENVNDLKRYSNLFPNQTLSSSGEWLVEEQVGSVFYFDFWESPRPTVTVALTDGAVSGVTVETVCTDPNAFFLLSQGNVTYKQLAATAFLGARREFNSFTWPLSGTLERIAEGKLSNYSFQAAGITVKQSVEYRGYELLDNEALLEIKGEDPYCRILFTMEKN